MHIAGMGHAAIEAHERAEREALTFTSAKQALKVLDDLETVERGSDALGERLIRWHARVRHAAYAYLRDHEYETACERVERLQAAVTEWRRRAEQDKGNLAHRKMCLEAAAEAADELSGQLAALAGMMARGEAA